MAQRLHLGQILTFDGSPFELGQDAGRHIRHGAILVTEGKITDLGEAVDLRAKNPQAQISDHGNSLLMAGFVDAHVHYAQTGIIASWGKRLIDWLNSYTFPEEARFGDLAYATLAAQRYLELILAHGTTSFCSYGTIHPESVDAIFQAATQRNMRAWAGKTAMDRNAPENLTDTPQSAYDDSKALLEKWHGTARNNYVVTPRFSPTSTYAQLEAMGALWAEHPDCLMQTHLSEQIEEIEWVKHLFPNARDYLDTYDVHGLLGERALFGHAIHLEPREKARLKETGAGLVHCPTSNMFIGSGLFDMHGLVTEGLNVGLATDTGGGSSFSMLRTMAAAYDVSQLRGTPLHPSHLLWLATAGSAKALHADHLIGNLAIGIEADFIALDLASTPGIAQRTDRAETIWEAVFPTIMMGDDRAITQVWLAGVPQKVT